MERLPDVMGMLEERETLCHHPPHRPSTLGVCNSINLLVTMIPR